MPQQQLPQTEEANKVSTQQTPQQQLPEMEEGTSSPTTTREVQFDLPIATVAQPVPASARASQWPCSLVESNGEGLDTYAEGADFPGASEILERQWSHTFWEMSGVRCVGNIYLTNFRLICDANFAPETPLDVGLTDVRDMHLEIPCGLIDQVEISPTLGIRQWNNAKMAFEESWAGEITVSCRDLRAVRIVALAEIVDSEQRFLGHSYSEETTKEILVAIQAWRRRGEMLRNSSSSRPPRGRSSSSSVQPTSTMSSSTLPPPSSAWTPLAKAATSLRKFRSKLLDVPPPPASASSPTAALPRNQPDPRDQREAGNLRDPNDFRDASSPTSDPANSPPNGQRQRQQSEGHDQESESQSPQKDGRSQSQSQSQSKSGEQLGEDAVAASSPTNGDHSPADDHTTGTSSPSNDNPFCVSPTPGERSPNGDPQPRTGTSVSMPFSGLPSLPSTTSSSPQHAMSGPLASSTSFGRPSNPGELFVKSVGRPTAGWDICEDAVAEFFKEQEVPQDRWRLTEANEHYGLCETYPSKLMVPVSVTDDQLHIAAQARARRRFPVLTYHHVKGSVLLRSAQPTNSASSQGAERTYLEACRQAVHRHAPLVIFDCRTQVAAQANRLFKGGGAERPDTYQDSGRSGDLNSVIQLDVPNIHEMLNSYMQLRALVERSDIPENRWLQRLGDTCWLEHCRKITEAAVTVARHMVIRRKDQPPQCVLVHCSDGWDRTAQVCSLAQLLMDRRYRTRTGFATLVDKDWRRFGHRFSERSLAGGQKASPIFLQFLFCVSAVATQFPSDFEFDSTDLMMLADLRLCGAMGTFLYNSEQEAVEANASMTQVSVWSIWLQQCLASVGLGAGCGGGSSSGSLAANRRRSSMARYSAGESLGMGLGMGPTQSRGGVYPRQAQQQQQVHVHVQEHDQEQEQGEQAAGQPVTASASGSGLSDSSNASFHGSFVVGRMPTGATATAAAAFPVANEVADRRMLLPVTSLKRFALWDFALRYDEVSFCRKRAHWNCEIDCQRVGGRLVVSLRDTGSAECLGCRGEFVLLPIPRRRHHCRACGLLFCSSCVQWRGRLPLPSGCDANGPKGPLEKLCRRCWELALQATGTLQGDGGHR